MKLRTPAILIISILFGAGLGIGIWWQWLRIVPEPANDLRYPLVAFSQLPNRQYELEGQKICLRGYYHSSFESSELTPTKISLPNQPAVWTNLQRSRQSYTSLLTVCGTFYSKAAGERKDTLAHQNATNGEFVVESGCCGHLSGWKYELDED